MLAVHVNDMAVAASSKAALDALISELQKPFEIVDLGDIKWFLSMAVSRD
jgi:hypothetical protein